MVEVGNGGGSTIGQKGTVSSAQPLSSQATQSTEAQSSSMLCSLLEEASFAASTLVGEKESTTSVEEETLEETSSREEVKEELTEKKKAALVINLGGQTYEAGEASTAEDTSTAGFSQIGQSPAALSYEFYAKTLEASIEAMQANMQIQQDASALSAFAAQEAYDSQRKAAKQQARQLELEGQSLIVQGGTSIGTTAVGAGVGVSQYKSSQPSQPSFQDKINEGKVNSQAYGTTLTQVEKTPRLPEQARSANSQEVNNQIKSANASGAQLSKEHLDIQELKTTGKIADDTDGTRTQTALDSCTDKERKKIKNLATEGQKTANEAISSAERQQNELTSSAMQTFSIISRLGDSLGQIITGAGYKPLQAEAAKEAGEAQAEATLWQSSKEMASGVYSTTTQQQQSIQQLAAAAQQAQQGLTQVKA